jgi:hypothetical protein
MEGPWPDRAPLVSFGSLQDTQPGFEIGAGLSRRPQGDGYGRAPDICPSFPSSSLGTLLSSKLQLRCAPDLVARRKQSFQDIPIPKLELGNEGG